MKRSYPCSFSRPGRARTSSALRSAYRKRSHIFIVTLAALILAGCANNSYSQVSADGGTFLPVRLPAVPDRLDFAGEAVPLQFFDIRESLQKELLVSCNMHSRTFQSLLNMKRYFSIIEPILESNGIPDDFKYLCMAESGLNPEAVSGAGAGGMWQFMPKTAREYGMIVGTQIDERFNVEKSTEAACRYIREAYDRLGSWTLAAAAYNAGNAGVSRRVAQQGTGSYYDTYLPHETMRYVFRILSLKMICSDPQAYGFMISEDDSFPVLDKYTEVKVNGRDIDWSAVAREHGSNYKMLRLLNPWIRTYVCDNAEGRTFLVKVPGKGFRRQ